MIDSPWSRPITGTPLDYVPIDAPVTAETPTVFATPIIRRAALAGLVAALVLSGFAFPAFGAGMVAIAAMIAVIWGADRMAERLNNNDRITTPANWPPPFNWIPTVVAVAIILAIVYFI